MSLVKILLLSAVLGFVGSSTAFSSQGVAAIPDSLLTDAQRAYLKTREAAAQVSVVTAAAKTSLDIGAQVGEAVRETLAALGDFSNTWVGKFILGLVAYRVIGQQAVGLLFGFPLLMFGTLVWLWLYRKNCMTQRVVVKEEGWGPWRKSAEYKIIAPVTGEGLEDGGKTVIDGLGWSRVWFTVPYLAFVAIMLGVIF